MEFKIEQKIVAVYFALGLLVALASSFIASLSPSNGLMISISISLAVYIIALVTLLRLVKYKKTKTLVQNSMLSYFLIWLVVWLLLYNL
jgi:Mn2+/Fe2+ NRAMP family transporter